MKRNRYQRIADLKSQTPAAQESAWEELSQMVFRVACHYLQNRADVQYCEVEQLAQEAAQEALIDILRKLDTFRGDSKFTTWAYQVVVNNARELLRKRPPPSWFSLDDEETFALIEVIPDRQATDPHVASEDRDLVRAIQKIINTTLPDRQRQVLLMHCLADYDASEIAERIGTTRNNVYQLLHQARKRIKCELQKRGYTANDL